MPKPHGSNDSNDSSFPDAPHAHWRPLRSRRVHGSGGLHPRGYSTPSRAVVPVVQASIGSWLPDDRPGSHADERSGSGRPGLDAQSDQRDRAGQRPPLTPQYHWHQDTHHHYYPSAQHVSPQPQPPRQAAFALPTVPQPVAQPRLPHAGGCLVVSLVLLGAFLTFLVMPMGLALAGQILMLR